MRKLTILAAMLVVTSSSWADSGALSAAEVKTAVKDRDPQIGQCYLAAVGERIGAGRLDVVLQIHRKGLVDHIDVIAPGVDARMVKKIDACVREALAGIAFPSRRAGTTATIPYHWHKTSAPGDGPQYSCWNPRGCKTTEAAPSGSAPAESKSATPAHRTKKIGGRQARRAKA